jgi:hypothetical protein
VLFRCFNQNLIVHSTNNFGVRPFEALG